MLLCFIIFCLQMRDLLQDYVQSGDSEATMKQIKEWDVPHFNHEIVYDVSFCLLFYFIKRS